MINKAGWILLVLLSVFMLFHEVQSHSPCSAWAEHPENCGSNNFGE